MSKTQHSIFSLPQDVIFDILSRLPTKSLIQFRTISTASPPLISHPSFTKLHLSSSVTADQHLIIYYESTDYINQFYSLRSPITLQETLKLQIPYKHVHGYLRIVGSNKGLICFFDTNYYSSVGKVILWNPSIQKFRKIEDPHDLHDKFSHSVVGFGFISRMFEFKVVQIAYCLDTSKLNSVLVYTLSTDSWKKVDSIAPCYLIRGWYSNVFVNGFVNWMVCKSAITSEGMSDAIMAFDLDNECFHVLELPKNITPYDQACLASSMGRECLLFCAHYVELNGERWDMWVMSDYGVVDSWKKVCVVSQPSLSILPFLMRGDGEVLTVMNDGRLMLCDSITGEMRDLKTCGLAHSFHVVEYTASLALLHG